jgi:hypothetical protein
MINDGEFSVIQQRDPSLNGMTVIRTPTALGREAGRAAVRF